MKVLKKVCVFLFIGLAFSCSDSATPLFSSLKGTYTESIPFSGTHQLIFHDHHTVILKAKNTTDEVFYYQIERNVLTLNPKRDISKVWDLKINIISDSKFELTNIFYASIPEDPNPLLYVTFEK